jgi:hypothetical protein
MVFTTKDENLFSDQAMGIKAISQSGDESSGKKWVSFIKFWTSANYSGKLAPMQSIVCLPAPTPAPGSLLRAFGLLGLDG